MCLNACVPLCAENKLCRTQTIACSAGVCFAWHQRSQLSYAGISNDTISVVAQMHALTGILCLPYLGACVDSGTMLAVLQVLDMPQTVPAEALEARQRLAGLLHPTPTDRQGCDQLVRAQCQNISFMICIFTDSALA